MSLFVAAVGLILKFVPAISEARRSFPRFSCLPLPCYGTMAAAALTHVAWEPSVGFKPQFTPEGEPDYSHWQLRALELKADASLERRDRVKPLQRHGQSVPSKCRWHEEYA